MISPYEEDLQHLKDGLDMSSQYIVPENTTEVFYPKSKRKKVIDSKGNVVYDSNNDKK
jgi:hypothetical protein